jgi:hypothetical protein
MAPFSSPSLGVSQDLHQAIKGNEVESISSLGLAEKYEETYAMLHPIFPITSLSIIVGFDTTQRALPSGGILPYFVCIYSSPPTDPTQKILCYKGNPEHFMHLVRLIHVVTSLTQSIPGSHAATPEETLTALLLLLRTEFSHTVRVSFEAQSRDLSPAAWLVKWRAKHDLTADAATKMAVAAAAAARSVMDSSQPPPLEMPPAYTGTR